MKNGKILIPNRDAEIESDESDDDALSSEGSMPKLFIRNNDTEIESCEKEFEWEKLIDTEDTD